MSTDIASDIIHLLVAIREREWETVYTYLGDVVTSIQMIEYGGRCTSFQVQNGAKPKQRCDH